MNGTQEKKSSQGFLSFLQVGVLEAIFIALLVAIIIVTLNYFNVVPLSRTFSLLSFLPQQKDTSPQKSLLVGTPPTITKGGPTIHYLITPNDPKKFTNDTSEYKHTVISDSTIKVRGELGIDIEIGIDLAGEKSSQSSGFQFTNALPSEKDSITLFLYLLPSGREWGIQYRHADSEQIFPLFKVPSGKIYGKFSLNISSDGRRVSATLPSGEKKTIVLPDTIYSVTNLMSSAVLVAPNLEVSIFSLNYRYQFPF